MTYISTKTFPPLSACFRQHKADSHCRFLHGYGLVVRVTFAAEELDHRNWVIDFGGLKSFKEKLEDAFDHKLLVAVDDPQIDEIASLETFGLAQIVYMPAVGCEAFAASVASMLRDWLVENGHAPRVRVDTVEVSEHQHNSAIYRSSK